MSISIQNELEYRFNYISGLIGSFIPLLVNILIWFSVNNFSQEKFGFTLIEIVNYYFLILIVSNIISSSNLWEVASDIRTGQLNKYLIKTVDYMSYYLFIDIPRRLVFILVSIIPLIIVGIVFKKYITITITFYNISFFIISLVLGYLINFLINFLVSEYAFYFSEVTALFGAYNVLLHLVSGKIIPLNIFPEYIYKFLLLTPFQFGGFFQSVILLNKLTNNEILLTSILGAVWVIILLILCKLIWKQGIKRYSAFGG